jgi:hypothetical protein
MKEFKVMRTRRKRTSFTTKKRRNYSFTPRRRKSYNKSGTVIAMVLCAVVMIGSVCAVCIKFLSYDWGRSATPELAVADSCVVENDQLTTLIMKNGDVNLLSPAVSEKALESLEFTSSDESIVSVDSGGRVDAKKRVRLLSVSKLWALIQAVRLLSKKQKSVTRMIISLRLLPLISILSRKTKRMVQKTSTA